MSVAKGRNRRREFEALSSNAVQDFDPENDAPLTDEGSDDGLDDSSETDGGRQHYVASAKSKLRKPKEVKLGPQYRGSRISREEMMDDDDEEDDPFSKDFEDEDSEEDDAELEDGLSGESDEDQEDDDNSGEETGDTEFSDREEEPVAIDKAELRKAMAAEQTTVAATISAANKADAEKGRAVMQQRTTFDALLNTRIKLQKSLIATNSLVALDGSQLDDLRTNHEDAIAQAETAAQNLWSTLTSFRDQLNTAKTGEKRKAASTASLSGLMSQLKTQEDSVATQRSAILQKWSMKSRGVSATPQRGRLNNEQPATIVDVLNEHLSSSERLLKRARTPRSCAPVQLAKRISEDEHIYDDADFYGLLLKELLEAKSSASAAAATNVDLTNFANMRRDAKTRKNVDTKASKGRKLKYTVHEKLQNYCAPEDRTTWGARQVDELFTSLFGQSVGLNEDKVMDDDAEMTDEVGDANLIMFKTT